MFRKSRFPDTIRIMLTGEARIEDAQRVINQGEVYKFLLKPCKPDELRLVVKHACAHLDLGKANKNLAERIQLQQKSFGDMEKKYPGISSVVRDEKGAIVVDDILSGESFDDFMKRYFQE